MTNTKNCSVRILNKNYEIKCPEHETENLQTAAAKLNDELLNNKRKFKHLDEYQSLILAALTISHELISCQKQQEQQRYQVTEFINSLENKISQVVGSKPSYPPETD